MSILSILSLTYGEVNVKLNKLSLKKSFDM
jgi:hypothetical protein